MNIPSCIGREVSPSTPLDPVGKRENSPKLDAQARLATLALEMLQIAQNSQSSLWHEQRRLMDQQGRTVKVLANSTRWDGWRGAAFGALSAASSIASPFVGDNLRRVLDACGQSILPQVGRGLDHFAESGRMPQQLQQQQQQHALQGAHSDLQQQERQAQSVLEFLRSMQIQTKI